MTDDTKPETCEHNGVYYEDANTKVCLYCGVKVQAPDTKPESASERVVYLATCSIRDYTDPTEPNLYPDKFTAFVRKSAYDRQEKTIEELRAGLEKIITLGGDCCDRYETGHLCEPFKIAEETLQKILVKR